MNRQWSNAPDGFISGRSDGSPSPVLAKIPHLGHCDTGHSNGGSRLYGLTARVAMNVGK